MTKLDKYYIYQTFGKPRRAKERILEELGEKFRGLITIIAKKRASHVDYTSIKYHYVLNNTTWKRINNAIQTNLIVINDLKYEHKEFEA